MECMRFLLASHTNCFSSKQSWRCVPRCLRGLVGVWKKGLHETTECPVGYIPSGGNAEHLPWETQPISPWVEMHTGLCVKEGHWHSRHFEKAQNLQGKGRGSKCSCNMVPGKQSPRTLLVFSASIWWRWG